MAKKDFLPGSKLGKEQEDILNNRNDSSFIVKGCAGSGKSLLALLTNLVLFTESSSLMFWFS